MQPRGPYHVLGMSMGGFVAHAIACQLQGQGEEVACLGVMDSYLGAPGEVALEPEISELFELVQFDTEHLKGKRVTIPTVVEVAQQVGHVIGFLEVEQIERMLRFLKHATMLRLAFRPRVFRGNMLFFAATQGRPGFFSTADWRDYVTGEIKVHELHCRHPRITDPEQIAIVGRVLRNYLAERSSRPAAAMQAFYNEPSSERRL